MALELRPNCESCDQDLAADSTEAMICSYECTFCTSCVEDLRNVCPNCGGGFAARPIRPKQEWQPGLSLAKRPASTERVHMARTREEAAALSDLLHTTPPELR